MLAFVALTAEANAEVWISVCNDGKNVQYNQTVDGAGSLSLRIRTEDALVAIIQIAKVAQTFHNYRMICGTVAGSGLTDDERPISHICADLEVEAILVVYQHPFELDRPELVGHFCDATIRVDAD